MLRVDLLLIVAIEDYGLCEYYQEEVVMVYIYEVKIDVELLSNTVYKELNAIVQNVDVSHYYHDRCCSKIRTDKKVIHIVLSVLIYAEFFISHITLILGPKFKIHRHLVQSPHGKPEIIPKILPLSFFLLVHLKLERTPVVAEIVCLGVVIRRLSCNHEARYEHN